MVYQTKQHRYLSRKTGAMVGAIALGCTMFVLSSCNVVTDQEEIREGQTNVTTEDLAQEDLETETNGAGMDDGTEMADVESLIGQVVTVRSPVQDVLDSSGFTLETETGEPILVLNATGVPFSTPDNEDVPIQVTGEVTQFTLTDAESAYGIDLDEALYGGYEGQPAIVAESTALAPTTEDLTENPTAFDNQVIAMKGEVRNIYSPDAFSLFEEGWIDDIGILVVGVDRDLMAEGSALQEGEMVVVTGQTRPFDAATLQREYDLGLTPDQINEFADRYNRPVIMAEDIYPSAVDE